MTLINRAVTHEADAVNVKVEMQMISFKKKTAIKTIATTKMSADDIMKKDNGVGIL